MAYNALLLWINNRKFYVTDRSNSVQITLSDQTASRLFGVSDHERPEARVSASSRLFGTSCMHAYCIKSIAIKLDTRKKMSSVHNIPCSVCDVAESLSNAL